ncbi:NAD+ synthase [Alcaligenaceae bacterium SJ-26]|nr:NAD+ synthase [Alcaligenaceae bacterium SJ-26]
MTHAITVALAQINPVLGDLAGNAARILAVARQAHEAGARVLLTPELALTGYPPEDLLLRPEFLRRCEAVLAQLTADLAGLPDLSVVVGTPLRVDDRLFNAAVVLREGARIGWYGKQALPNYGVFDEQRYFAVGTQACLFEVGGLRFGVNVCEDLWAGGAPRQAVAQGAQVLLALNASPFDAGHWQARREHVMKPVAALGVPLVYVNLVGGQDELVFDGASFVQDAAGTSHMVLPAFGEALGLVDFDAQGHVQGGRVLALDGEDWSAATATAVAVLQPGSQLPDYRADSTTTRQAAEQQPPGKTDAYWPDDNGVALSAIWQALVLGVRDYVEKNGFKGVLLAFSGGMDSALTLLLAVDALGPERVRTYMMPSPYTSDMSLDDAKDMARRVGVHYGVLPIAPMMDAFESVLAPEFAGLTQDATEENIQARSRGVLMMALSNKTGWLVLTTGNKSEFSTGYCTLYGDMAGGFAVLKDVPKTLVYSLGWWRNGLDGTPPIPENILTRAPSAELRPGQTDQDSLPPYEVLDGMIARYMEQDASVDDLRKAGYVQADIDRFTRLLHLNEYKRRQSPPGPRITPRAFGRDWRYPITNRFRDNGQG